FVDVKVNNNLAAVGVDVKKVEKNLEVNAISTAFGHERSANNSEFVYVKKSLTPEQLALLDGLNFRQYLDTHGGGGDSKTGRENPPAPPDSSDGAPSNTGDNGSPPKPTQPSTSLSSTNQEKSSDMPPKISSLSMAFGVCYP
ncbi:MAG: hypothetical protein LBD22_05585, partial [Spirochaetaceae bacterium]|nr:hypothetical protein [Spirochaetaceae bacterium]